MKSFEKYLEARKRNNSILCVGLDSDLKKIPDKFGNKIESILSFNKSIIDATKDLVCAYKINFAFYEQYGVDGYKALKNTFDMIPNNIFTIADAKRSDIGNTSKSYAKSVFDYFGADSITVHPYMGLDSVKPFLDYDDRIVFLLALTSNSGAKDFQYFKSNEEYLYERVIKTSEQWADSSQLGYVVGATHQDELSRIRQIVPKRLLLVPGIGSQGGDIQGTLKSNSSAPAIINVSRAVIYPKNYEVFENQVKENAKYYKEQFNKNI